MPFFSRAGLDPSTPEFRALLELALKSPAIEVFGFYCHAGRSYASTSQEEASKYLTSEVNAVNDAAQLALSILKQGEDQRSDKQFVLSVGSTPTAHAATVESRAKVNELLYGKLELHAGESIFLGGSFFPEPNPFPRKLPTTRSSAAAYGVDRPSTHSTESYRYSHFILSWSRARRYGRSIM